MCRPTGAAAAAALLPQLLIAAGLDSGQAEAHKAMSQAAARAREQYVGDGPPTRPARDGEAEVVVYIQNMDTIDGGCEAEAFPRDVMIT